jgi:hypothetical protein
LVQGNDGIDVHPGECICWSIVSSTDVTDICGELGHKIEVPGLSAIMMGSEREGERSVIHQYMEFLALHRMSEMSDGQVYCQELPVKGAIPGLRWL